MKPTKDFLRCLGRFANNDKLTFAEQVKDAVLLAEGTKLRKLVDAFLPLSGSAHLWLVCIHKDFRNTGSLSDNFFDYDRITEDITSFFKKVFMSGKDHRVIEVKIDNSHSMSFVISFHNGETTTSFKVVSSILFQDLDQCRGFYIPYLATTGDKFKLRGDFGDHRPWRRRGITSLLLNVLQTICQLRYNITSLFLECREVLVPTYTKFGFCRCYALDKSWDVPDSMSLEPSLNLVRMWNGTKVVTKAAVSGTASIVYPQPFRSCCQEVAFRGVQAQRLMELDVFLFEYFDCFEQDNSNYVGRCTMCGDVSEDFPMTSISLRFYEYASSHIGRCTALRRDNKKRQMVDVLVQDTKSAMARPQDVSDKRVEARNDWLRQYAAAITDSSCIPGCGVPNQDDRNAGSSFLWLLPQRYSLRIASKGSETTNSMLSARLTVISHLQYTANGQFVGYNIQGTSFLVEKDYVNNEFHDWYIDYVTRLSPRKMPVPDGSSANVGGMPKSCTGTLSQSCPVAQQLHRDTCVFSSALSAFRHFGDLKAVASIRDRLFASTTKADRLVFLVETLANHRLL